MLVAVKRHGFTMFFNILSSSVQVVEGRLGLTKMQLHKAACSIFDESQEAAFISAGFEAGVWNPESVSDHPTAQRFNRNLKAMAFQKLLGG